MPSPLNLGDWNKSDAYRLSDQLSAVESELTYSLLCAWDQWSAQGRPWWVLQPPQADAAQSLGAAHLEMSAFCLYRGDIPQARYWLNQAAAQPEAAWQARISRAVLEVCEILSDLLEMHVRFGWTLPDWVQHLCQLLERLNNQPQRAARLRQLLAEDERREAMETCLLYLAAANREAPEGALPLLPQLLGLCCALGLGVERDPDQARALFLAGQALCTAEEGRNWFDQQLKRLPAE